MTEFTVYTKADSEQYWISQTFTYTFENAQDAISLAIGAMKAIVADKYGEAACTFKITAELVA